MSDQAELGQAEQPSTVMVRALESKVNQILDYLQERDVRQARVSREEVIRNPRLSVGGSGGSGFQSGVFSGSSGSSPVVDPREELFSSPNPPRRQGRLTLSPHVESDGDEVQEPVSRDEVKEPVRVPHRSPPVAEDSLFAVQRRAGEERLLKKVKTPPTFSGNEAEDEISEVRDWVEVVDDFFDCMVGTNYDGEYALTFVKNNLRGPAHD